MEGWVFPEDHPKFHSSPVADLSDTDLYFSTFCAADQARQKVTWGQTGGYPTCFFCGQQYRYSVFAVECHFDHTLNKKSCGKDRLCKTCPFATKHHVSEHKARKARFTEVQMAIRSRSHSRKAKELSDGQAMKRQKLNEVGGREDDPLVVEDESASIGSGSKTAREPGADYRSHQGPVVSS